MILLGHSKQPPVHGVHKFSALVRNQDRATAMPVYKRIWLMLELAIERCMLKHTHQGTTYTVASCVSYLHIIW